MVPMPVVPICKQLFWDAFCPYFEFNVPQEVTISDEPKVDLQYVFFNNIAEVEMSVTPRYFGAVVGHVTVYSENYSMCA